MQRPSSKSLVFPQYAPDLAFTDDRLIAIADKIHEIIALNRANHNNDNKLEIEAKLG